jgi:chromosomal replication initiation ATPase DnaA
MENDIQVHIKRLSAYELAIMNTICDYLNIQIDDLLGQDRKRRYVNARKMASYLFKKNGYTNEFIGTIISLIPKDPTSIIYNVRKANAHYNLEPDFKFIVDKVGENVKKTDFII